MKEHKVKQAYVAADYELRIPTPCIKRWLLAGVVDELGLGNGLDFIMPSDLEDLIRKEGYKNFLEFYDAHRETNYEYWEGSQAEALAFADRIMEEDYFTEDKIDGFPLALSYSFDATELELWLGQALSNTMNWEAVLAEMNSSKILELATYTRIRLGDETEKPLPTNLSAIRQRLRKLFPYLYLTSYEDARKRC